MVTIPTSETVGMIKPREIREALRGKIDPQVGAVLVRLAEDNRETRNQVRAVAGMMDQFSNVINSMMHIAEAMKLQHERRFGPLAPPSQGENASDKINAIAVDDNGG